MVRTHVGARTATEPPSIFMIPKAMRSRLGIMATKATAVRTQRRKSLYRGQGMDARPEATIEDLYHVKGKAELVDGKILLMAPTGGIPGYAGDEIFASLRDYVRRIHKGYAVGDNKAFRVNLPQRKSFSPDAA